MSVFGQMLAIANGVLKPAGLSVNKLSEKNRFVLHEYRKPDGSFDYEKYRAVQTQGNLDKIGAVWANKTNIDFLADYIVDRIVGKPEFGICHGTRRGMEQKWFRERLECEVIGTEISTSATQFENTIQWDFHDVKPEWISSVDFIYSNSFDHSHSPNECLTAWMSCVKPNGICFLEHTDLHGPKAANELDPFGAELAIMPYLIATWSKGKFGVTDILKAPAEPDDANINTYFLCVRNVASR